MKKLLLFCFAISAFAQTQSHQVTLSWTDTANPAGTTYNVYRAAGNCPASAPVTGFSVLNTSAISVKSYIDTTVAGGQTYCYYVTAVNGSNQSGPSNTVPAAVSTLYAPLFSITIAQ